jgi:hypothetical protein
MGEEVQPSIRINKEGIWYHGNNEIWRKEIVALFYDNLKLDISGRYLIELGNEKCYIKVEDAPFVVKAVHLERGETDHGNEEVIYLHLSDDKFEHLDLNTLWVSAENILYCFIKNAVFKARFSRQSYYQIADYIEYNDENDEYFIPLNGRSYSIKQSI